MSLVVITRLTLTLTLILTPLFSIYLLRDFSPGHSLHLGL